MSSELNFDAIVENALSAPVNVDLQASAEGAQSDAQKAPKTKRERRAEKKAAKAQTSDGAPPAPPAKKTARSTQTSDGAPRKTSWRAPTLSRDSIDRDFACLLLCLTAEPQTMAQLVERANTLAKLLNLKRYEAHECEKRNRDDKCKFSHLRYKSYHDLTDSAQTAGAVLKVKSGRAVTLQLGPNANELLKTIRAVKRELLSAKSKTKID